MNERTFPMDPQVEEEHVELRSLLRTIESLEEPFQLAGKDTDLTRLAANVHSGLKRLLELLAGHFAREETDDGFFAEIRRRLPAAATDLEGLVEEHRGLLDRTTGLARTVAAEIPAAPEVVREYFAEVRLLVRDLRRHEMAENDLVQRAFTPR